MPLDAAPTKPSQQFLEKYLRFIDPSDATKVIQLSIKDTGLTTTDGLKIYSLGMSPAGSDIDVLIKNLNTKTRVGSPESKEVYSPPESELVFFSQLNNTSKAALPVSIMGAGARPIVSGTYPVPPVSTVTSPAEIISNASRVVGVIRHNFTNAAPGIVYFIMSNDPLLSIAETYPNTTMIKVILDDSNSKTATFPNDRVEISLERTGLYFKMVLVNADIGLTFDVETAINLGV